MAIEEDGYNLLSIDFISQGRKLLRGAKSGMNCLVVELLILFQQDVIKNYIQTPDIYVVDILCLHSLRKLLFISRKKKDRGTVRKG